MGSIRATDRAETEPLAPPGVFGRATKMREKMGGESQRKSPISPKNNVTQIDCAKMGGRSQKRVHKNDKNGHSPPKMHVQRQNRKNPKHAPKMVLLLKNQKKTNLKKLHKIEIFFHISHTSFFASPL